MLGKTVELPPPRHGESGVTPREREEVRDSDVTVNITGYSSRQDHQYQHSQMPPPPPPPPPGFHGQYSSGAGDPSDIPMNVTAGGYRSRPWHYSLCVCCQDMDSCCESWCCTPCQQSRQCNMFMSNHSEIHWPYCLLLSFVDPICAFGLLSCIFACQTRRLARERYGVSGSGFGDCCTGWCCRVCNTQQVLLEMTVMNDFPGATCYNATPQPMECQMS